MEQGKNPKQFNVSPVHVGLILKQIKAFVATDLEAWMLLLRGADRSQQNAISIISALQNAKLL